MLSSTLLESSKKLGTKEPEKTLKYQQIKLEKLMLNSSERLRNS
ncbi:hypothetical protein Ptr902_08533 [Pyrenophora tritici-repentis]|nr:hypothetical protein Ptr902_08533 [Pyrenophora tritici-repentis]